MSGTLEILHYVPDSLLVKDIGELEITEFIKWIACARYVQKIECDNMSRAIANVFSE